jgi:hypothetical protein
MGRIILSVRRFILIPNVEIRLIKPSIKKLKYLKSTKVLILRNNPKIKAAFLICV